LGGGDISGRAKPNESKKSTKINYLVISGLPIPAQFRACHVSRTVSRFPMKGRGGGDRLGEVRAEARDGA
jgi:hypothetical protein